jgi:polyisoprenoid-binding protein YceI
MKYIILPMLASLFSLGLVPKPLSVTRAEVRFTIKNAGLPVNGTLGELEAKLSFDPAEPEKSHLEATVAVATLATGIGARDRHLMKPEYFDVAKYPTIKLSSTSVARQGKSFVGQFSLTIKGKTRAIAMPFTYSTTSIGSQLEGTFRLNRRDFNVGGDSWVLADNVDVTIKVEVGN